MTNSLTRIALLRAVNVGGRSMKMAELKTMVEGLGFMDVRTLLQSGNLVFTGAEDDDREVERRLEVETEKRFGFDVDFIVRREPEWAEMIAANPFEQEAVDDPSHLLTMPLKAAPGADALDKLRTAIKGREQVEIVGRNAYLVYPDGIGDSKLTIAVIERHLGVRSTGRNWNTVQKLASLAAG